MSNTFPLRLLLALFAGWLNRQQAQVIDYLVEENRILKEQLGSKRLRLTDDQRRRLAAKGKPLGRRVLGRNSVAGCFDLATGLHPRPNQAITSAIGRLGTRNPGRISVG